MGKSDELGINRDSLSPFLVISNFNTFPAELIEISSRWILYDVSTEEKVINQLKNLHDERVIFNTKKNVGHNLVNYLTYIIDNYNNLPRTIAFIKGNIIGRHCSREWLMNSLNGNSYAFLYEDKDLKEKKNVQYLLYPSKYIEVNNSWFAWSHPHRFFTNLNDFLSLLFEDYKPSEYVMFAPGACYVVERERICRYPRSFWQGIRLLIQYDYRVAEAFFLERSLNIIFDAKYKLKEYTYDFERFKTVIDGLPDLSAEQKSKSSETVMRKVRFKLIELLSNHK